MSEQHRVVQIYTEDEIEDIKANSRPVERYIEVKIKKNQLFTNQLDCAERVFECFKDTKVTTVLVSGRTQAGKTGCAECCIYNFLTKDLIPIDNIYIVTGLASNKWKDQTRDRISKVLYENIMDRPTFIKNIEEISKKRNVLIIIDEVQIASLAKQKMAIQIKDCLKNIMYSHNIKIIELSATPNGTVYDNPSLIKIPFYPGPNYTSLYDIKHMGNTRQFKNLKCNNLVDIMTQLLDKKESPEIIKKIHDLDVFCKKVILDFKRNELVQNYIDEHDIPIDSASVCESLEELHNILENIIEIYDENNNFNTPGYILIRTHTGQYQANTIELFKIIFPIEEYEYLKYDSTTDIDLNAVLKNKPDKTTIIFIKEMCRCSDTLNKKYIHIVYERYSTIIDDSIMIQGGPGRITGYDYNGKTICFLNEDSIDKQEQLIKTSYEDKSIQWKSNSTKINNGEITSKGTLNNIFNLDETDTTFTIQNKFYVRVETFYIKTGESLLMFFNRVKTKHSRNPFCEKNREISQFYKASTTKISKVYSIDELRTELSGLKGSSGFDIGKKIIDNYKSDDIIQTRLYVCYTNTIEYNQDNTVIIKRTLFKM